MAQSPKVLFPANELELPTTIFIQTTDNKISSPYLLFDSIKPLIAALLAQNYYKFREGAFFTRLITLFIYLT